MRPTSYLIIITPFLWSLVKVHSQQTFPYVSFKGSILDNHSYVNLERVGENSNGTVDNVRCHTDLVSCCVGKLSHRGDWYFPNGTRLPFGPKRNIIESRGIKVIDLRRTKTVTSPTGIYRCDVSTRTVNDNFTRKSVYVGLYTNNGGNIICAIIMILCNTFAITFRKCCNYIKGYDIDFKLG